MGGRSSTVDIIACMTFGTSLRRSRMGGRCFVRRRRRSVGRELRAGRRREIYRRSILFTVKSSHGIKGIMHQR